MFPRNSLRYFEESSFSPHIFVLKSQVTSPSKRNSAMEPYFSFLALPTPTSVILTCCMDSSRNILPLEYFSVQPAHSNIAYPLSYGVPVRERYGSTLLPATREQHDQNCTQSHLTRDLKRMYSRLTLVRISINL